MFKSLPIMLLIVTISSLHLEASSTHLLTNQSNPTTAALNQNYLQTQFAQIQTKVQNVKQSLTTKDTNKFSFLIQKCTEIKTGLSVLQQTLQKYQLPINSVNMICPNISAFNRTEIRKYITYIEEKVRAMQDYELTCSDCGFISKDIDEIHNKTNKQIKLINKTLDGKFCNSIPTVLSEKAVGFVNLNNSFFKNNLNAKNWFYGSTTASDYKIYLFKRASTFNLTNCPLDTPFVKDDQQVCFNCPEGSIFDLGSQACDTCHPDQILNVDSGNCDKCYGQKRFINGSLVCFPCDVQGGQILNMTTGKCETCGSNSYLQVKTLSCQKMNCKGLTPKFNMATKTCEACGISQIINPNDITQCIKTNYVALCPSATPLYDEASHTCKTCPASTVYNQNKNTCDAPLKSHQSLKIIPSSMRE